MKVEVEITESMMKDVEMIMETRTNKSLEMILTQLMERGIYQLKYRTERNRMVYEREKGLREEFKQFKASKR